MYKKINCCRGCRSTGLTRVLSLGDLAVSDFVHSAAVKPETKAPLELVLCDKEKGGCGLLQLMHTVSAESMYKNYWYRSGINKTMTDELVDITKEASKVADLKSGDYVIDIGANDGTLLRGYDIDGLKTIGFEPARNLEEFGSNGTTEIIVDFFNCAAWKERFGQKKARVITAIGMFYDLDDPNTFLEDICQCLDDEGVFIIQMMYMPYAIERNAFDGICHEHLEYYTLASLDSLLERNGLEVVDVQLREEINEGSARFFIRKKGCSIGNASRVEGGKRRVDKMREMEKHLDLESVGPYEELARKISAAKTETLGFLKSEKKKGKVIHGYAASTKGNTTLQYYGLDTKIIDAIADRNPAKWGKYTVSTSIPIISESDSRRLNPDYYFVLAWHFLPEFLEREQEFLERGGKFVVPMPRFKVISREDLK